MKKVFCVLTFLSFFYVLGVVGSIEQDLMPLGAGAVRCFLGIGAFGLFSELGGLTYSSYRPKRKAAPRCSRPKDGKRKSSI